MTVSENGWKKFFFWSTWCFRYSILTFRACMNRCLLYFSAKKFRKGVFPRFEPCSFIFEAIILCGCAMEKKDSPLISYTSTIIMLDAASKQVLHRKLWVGIRTSLTLCVWHCETLSPLGNGIFLFKHSLTTFWSALLSLSTDYDISWSGRKNSRDTGWAVLA